MGDPSVHSNGAFDATVTGFLSIFAVGRIPTTPAQLAQTVNAILAFWRHAHPLTGVATQRRAKSSLATRYSQQCSAIAAVIPAAPARAQDSVVLPA